MRTREIDGVPIHADYLWQLSKDGRLFIASDADANDTVTGQTSFANTTPTLLLSVPVNTVAIPLFLNLSQTGSVAGGAIQVIVEIDNVARYASAGTAEKVFNPNRELTRSGECSLYSGATATAGYGVRVWGATIGPDVSPAEGAIQGPFWRPELPYFLEGPASLLVFTYASVTGPTWFWSLGWVEFETKYVVS